MKIGLDGVNLVAATGPNVFGSRLAQAFTSLGHKVDMSCEGCDVILTFIQPSRRYPQGTKVVQRLDGIWFSPKDFEARNTEIKALYQSCDRVIWQSHFDRNMTTKWWGERPGEVIHNGVPRPLYGTSNKPGSKRFACVASWHPQKRLRANIDLFLQLTRLDSDASLYVVGYPDVLLKHPRVLYLGARSPQDVAQVLNLADWLIHLAWLDHCPNAVVEALGWGCGIIAASSGGTKELLDPNYDVVLRESKAYDYELADYDDPPSIDVSQVKSLPQGGRPSFRAPDILDVAKSYVNTFEEIV